MVDSVPGYSTYCEGCDSITPTYVIKGKSKCCMCLYDKGEDDGTQITAEIKFNERKVGSNE